MYRREPNVFLRAFIAFSVASALVGALVTCSRFAFNWPAVTYADVRPPVPAPLPPAWPKDPPPDPWKVLTTYPGAE